jgi:hypothetical protein
VIASSEPVVVQLHDNINELHHQIDDTDHAHNTITHSYNGDANTDTDIDVDNESKEEVNMSSHLHINDMNDSKRGTIAPSKTSSTSNNTTSPLPSSPSPSLTVLSSTTTTTTTTIGSGVLANDVSKTFQVRQPGTGRWQGGMRPMKSLPGRGMHQNDLFPSKKSSTGSGGSTKHVAASGATTKPGRQQSTLFLSTPSTLSSLPSSIIPSLTKPKLTKQSSLPQSQAASMVGTKEKGVSNDNEDLAATATGGVPLIPFPLSTDNLFHTLSFLPTLMFPSLFTVSKVCCLLPFVPISSVIHCCFVCSTFRWSIAS